MNLICSVYEIYIYINSYYQNRFILLYHLFLIINIWFKFCKNDDLLCNILLRIQIIFIFIDMDKMYKYIYNLIIIPKKCW